MKLNLASRWMRCPRNAQGDVAFTELLSEVEAEGPIGVLDVFTKEEVVELVNRALYQLEYQASAHAKRGREERARNKALKEALRKAGKDPKVVQIKDELEGK